MAHLKSKIIALGAAMAIGVSVNANAQSNETCRQIHQVATVIMAARQNGESMARVMGAVNGNSLAQAIVRDAYNQPAYDTAEFKQRTTRRFANDVANECYRQIN